MTLSLQQKLEKDLPIWVRNMTTAPAAMVCVSFSYNGAKELVKIPPGRYPFQIWPGLVSKDMVANGSAQLQHFLNTGALKMVSNKFAQKVLQNPDAQEEQKALFHRANTKGADEAWAKKQRRIAEGKTSGIEEVDGYVKGPPGLPESVKNSLTQDPLDALKQRMSGGGDNSASRSQFELAKASSNPKVQPRVLGIMSGWSNETDEGCLRQLKAVRSQLTVHDVHYVMGACMRNCRTSKWAKRIAEKADI